MASRLFHFICDPIGPKVKMATYLAAKVQQEGTSKRRKTPKGFYRKTFDYIKAYSPAYDLIREQLQFPRLWL